MNEGEGEADKPKVYRVRKAGKGLDEREKGRPRLKGADETEGNGGRKKEKV